MSDMMTQMIKMMQEISEALPFRKENMSDAHNLNQRTFVLSMTMMRMMRRCQPKKLGSFIHSHSTRATKLE
ncbi:hypothetical protein J1N35_043398 [Gossypium stocksii]|uniref:Uncharacterized protein n=1 Tax=Gossypium stocksii TaxID=47602 RepID=A0A9D3U7G5_9ROSI|nr:hypothetical protein J1N35_043398 [Gossypium stocksii]